MSQERNNTIRAENKSIIRSKIKKIEHRGGLSRYALLGCTALFGVVVWSGAAYAADTVDGSSAEAAASETDDQASGDVILVTGSRAGTTEFNSLSPVQAVGSDALLVSGKSDLRTALADAVPSFRAIEGGNGSSISQPVRATSLRGLGGNQTLVLVNGRRRHNTALYNHTGGVAGAPVDLTHIPVGLIERVEVLTDGAAAQYGSEAIAGVVNIILKRDRGGGSAWAQHGQFGPDAAVGKQGLEHGATTIASVSAGFSLSENGGFLDISGEYRRFGTSNFGGPIGPPGTSNVRKIFADPDDPREYTESRYRAVNVVIPWGSSAVIGYNFEYPIGGLTFYSYGTFGQNSLTSNGTYRSENNPVTIVGVSPDGGYNPGLNVKQDDYQLLAGLRGDDLVGWEWDAGVNFGLNRGKGYVNGLNASFGGLTPYQTFYLGELLNAEVIGNFDITRSFDTGWFGNPLDVAAGVEFRHSWWEQSPGEPLSYLSGGWSYPDDYISPILAGRPAGIGSPFMSGFNPGDSSAHSRNNGAAYIDLTQQIGRNLRIGLAGRYEHYSDSGGAVAGKLAARYEFTPGFAIRATVNNGFRAPTLAEQYTSVRNQGPSSTGTQIVQINSYNSIRVDSPFALALGATPLKPEKSINFSGGFVARPLQNLNLSVDVYQIRINDRLALTGSFNPNANTPLGRAVRDLFISLSLDPTTSIQYITNIGDTRTRGIDFKADYGFDTDRIGRFDLTFGGSYKEHKVLRARPAPPDLAALGSVLLGAGTINSLELDDPKWTLRGVVNWSLGRFTARVTEHYFSGTRVPNTNFPNDRLRDAVNDAAFLTDIALSYEFLNNTTFTVGANNLFNKLPNLIQEANVAQDTVGRVYPLRVAAPWNVGGVHYYARIAFDW